MLATVFVASCSSDNEDDPAKDIEKPNITDGELPSPLDCEVYHKGGIIAFRYTFTDNLELGNFNIEIHNNFDHHSHSTSAGDCPLDSKKEPVNPWAYNQDYSIESGQTLYHASVDIEIPEDIDTGDYHFMVRLTDKTGWQQLKGISLKIVE